jgi:hypothetical protein
MAYSPQKGRILTLPAIANRPERGIQSLCEKWVERATRPMPLVFLLIFFELSARQ